MDKTTLERDDFIAGVGTLVDAIWEIDPEAGQIYVWKEHIWQTEERQYWSLQEAVAYFDTHYVYTPDRDKWRTAYAAETLRAFVASGEGTRRFEMRMKSAATGFTWQEVIWNVLPARDGGGAHLLALTRDLRDEKRALTVEAAVRTEYDYVVYLEAYANSYIRYMGNRMGGAPLPPTCGDDYEAEMAAYNSAHLVPELVEEITRCMRIQNVLRELEAQGEYVLYSRSYQGSEVRAKKLRYSYYNKDEGILILTRTDITEIRAEKQRNEALQNALTAAETANRAKSDFLSRMSHDIRTPMNAVIGLTTIAEEHIGENERVRDCLQKINGASKLLLGLINEVLDMSKIESGSIVLAEERFALGRLFEELVLILQPEIDRKRHRLDIHVEAVEHENLVGDVQRLQQALMNLMTNAIKYTPEGGHITLRLRECPTARLGWGCYEFTTEDNGIGMEPAFLTRIFDPFERADDPAVRAIQGTGLGMAISKNIVRMMDGDIHVQSKPGCGSRVEMTVYLKLGEQELPDATPLRGLPVLIVDDDPVVCEEVCTCLGSAGMLCQSVLNGDAALRAVAAAHSAGADFCAILLDQRLPGMSGLETMQRIRAALLNIALPIVIVSAYDSAAFEIEAQQAGADGFLVKPLFRSKLLYLLRQLVTQEAPQAVQTAAARADFSGRRVLLVEDNELNREIAIELIGMYGVTVDTAENGRKAVDKVFAAGPGWYDLIFMDIQMPVMDGYAATRAIRALDRPDAAQIPIIAMTANAFAEDVRAAEEAGMNRHMSKPIDVTQLSAILRYWLA